jgi:L-iditol 2-dehydrogenase
LSPSWSRCWPEAHSGCGDISIHTSRGEGGNNVKRAVALAAQGKLRGAEMVTHRFPLEDITTAFQVVRDRDGDPVKVVVLP